MSRLKKVAVRIQSPKSLLNLDDQVGQEIPVGGSFHVDNDNRDMPFVYLDGELLTGGRYDKTHTMIINQWCEDNGIDPMEEKWSRKDINDVSKCINKDKLGFGHVVDGMAFIEVLMGYTVNDISNALQQQGDFKKIYQWLESEFMVTRLASNKFKINNIMQKLKRCKECQD